MAAALVAGSAVGPVLVGAGASTAQARVRAADQPAVQATPLAVQLTGMTPAVIPAKGALLLHGVVSNVSDEEWTDINVAPFLSAEPITSRDDLAEADLTDADATVGTRLSDPSTYVKVGDLAAGKSTTFTIRVPRDSMGITGEPGVYWIGVHALGSNADGRDLVADGRARSFIPLVTKDQARHHVDVSLLLPMRERARRSGDGSLNGPSRWVALTGPEGRLTRLAEFAASAGSNPVTWEVDPAVLDALDDFARGNPPLSLGPRQRTEKPGKTPSPSPSASSSSSPSATATPSETSGERRVAADPGAVPDEQERARSALVLQTFLDAVRGQTLLSMPYGDLDVPSAVRSRPSLLTRAQSLSARRMKARALEATAAVAPPDGLFDPSLLGGVDAETLFVLGDHGSTTSPPYARLATGQPLVLSDERASAGGPTALLRRPTRSRCASGSCPRPPSTSTSVARSWSASRCAGTRAPTGARPTSSAASPRSGSTSCRSSRAARRRTTASSATAGHSARPRSVRSTSPPPGRWCAPVTPSATCWPTSTTCATG